MLEVLQRLPREITFHTVAIMAHIYCMEEYTPSSSFHEAGSIAVIETVMAPSCHSVRYSF